MRSVCTASTRRTRSRDPTLSTAIAAAVNTMVALAGPFRSGMSAISHRPHGIRLSAHIQASAARGWRIPARANAPSSAATCGGPHGQPPHQAAGTSGDSSRPSHPARQASIGYRAASGSGSTRTAASSRCSMVGGNWLVPGTGDPCSAATPCKVPAFRMMSPTVVRASAAYAARRSWSERHGQATAGAGRASTCTSAPAPASHQRRAAAGPARGAPAAAGALPVIRVISPA